MNNFRHSMMLISCKYTLFTFAPDTPMSRNTKDKDNLSPHFRPEVACIAQVALNQVECPQEYSFTSVSSSV